MVRIRSALRGKAGRYAAVAAGLVLLVATLAAIKYFQIAQLIASGEAAEAAGPPPEAVASGTAQAEAWESSLSAVGTIASLASIEIRNEVPGVVKRLGFDSGAQVRAGAILVELDAGIERSQLSAAQARLDNALVSLRRAKSLAAQGAAPRAQLDDAQAAYEVAQGEVAALNAQVAKKVIRAPFSGRVGIRGVSLGQYLDTGSRITVLDALGEVFVDFSLPQEDVADISIGMPVRISLRESAPETLEGRISAADPTVNAATRNLRYRAQVTDPKERLRPGMFVDVAVVRPQELQVVAVPATAIVHASYGDSVFVIEDKKPGTPGMTQTPDGKKVRIARQQFVRVGATRGDFVQVVEGLKPGQEVVTAGAFKLRNGSPVVIDDKAQVKPALDPRPENR